MTAAEVLALARARGVTILLDGDDLDVVAAWRGSRPCSHEEIRVGLTVLRDERHRIVQWINANFASSSPHFCRHCRRGPRLGDAWVRLYSGDGSGVVHNSCWPAWQAAGEAQARLALGLDP